MIARSACSCLFLLRFVCAEESLWASVFVILWRQVEMLSDMRQVILLFLRLHTLILVLISVPDTDSFLMKSQVVIVD